MNPGVMLEGLPCTHVKFPSTARAGVTHRQPSRWHRHFQFTNPATSKGAKPPCPRHVWAEKCCLHAELAELPAVVFESGFEPHVVSELSAPSDVVTVLIAHFCFKCF